MHKNYLGAKLYKYYLINYEILECMEIWPVEGKRPYQIRRREPSDKNVQNNIQQVSSVVLPN